MTLADQLARADQLQAAIAVLKQEIQRIEASGDVAPPGCRVMRYQVKTKTGKYWYYKLQALEPIFPTRLKDGKLSKYKHLGKAGSPPPNFRPFLPKVSRLKLVAEENSPNC